MAAHEPRRNLDQVADSIEARFAELLALIRHARRQLETILKELDQ